MSGRDLLLEFVQWLVDREGEFEDMFDDPLVAVLAVDEFLEAVAPEEPRVTRADAPSPLRAEGAPDEGARVG